MQQKRGVLFVLSGPSGVGKGTLKKMLLDEFKDQVLDSISATTRKPREGEEPGREYFFISRQDFLDRIANNDFLEYAEFSGNMYGTPKSYVYSLLEQGINVIAEIDVQGALQMFERMPDCVSIFIQPPSHEVLEARLRGRATESEEKIVQRLSAAERELSYAMKYRHRIVNNELKLAYEELKRIYLQYTTEANK
ncbi:MAG: guanylate kinase [Clostridia bacterium]|nr:guanylate kinase [Clostridia bacterium]